MSDTNNLYPIKEFKRIFGCSQFFKEYNGLYRKNKSDASKYDKWLDRQLAFLDAENPNMLVINRPQVFESIRSFSCMEENFTIYSIRRPEFAKNPRILFTFVGSDPDGIAILLLAFSELKSQTYERFVPVAIDRIKALLSSMEEN